MEIKIHEMMKIVFLVLVTPLALAAQKFNIETPVKFLALGDSYTIGQNVDARERWPLQLIDSLQKRGLNCYDPNIIAATGWRTSDLKKAVVAARLSNTYNLISLLIGVNNYFQGASIANYKIEFEELLHMAIALAGGDQSRVFVMSIPDYGFTPFGKPNQATITKGIDVFNDANKTIASKMGVHYVNITDLTRRGLNEPDLIASDGLHPSGKMYSEWVSKILEK